MIKSLSNKGFVIPLVVIALFIAAVFGAIYNQSIKSQRMLDLLFENDLRSYYIAQAGFQSYISKIQALDKYEDKWYPDPNYSSKDNYAYTEENGKGYYFTYASEIQVAQKFQYIFLLIKGTYEDRRGNKNITIIKANVNFDPNPPSPNNIKAKTVVSNKSSLNKRNLLEFIKDSSFSDDFKNVSSNITDLLNFFNDKKVSDINFENQTNLLQAIATLSFINQNIRKRLRQKRLAVDLENNQATQNAIIQASKLGNHFSPHSFASLFKDTKKINNSQLNHKKVSPELIQQTKLIEFLSFLDSLPFDLRLNINDRKNLPFSISGPLTAANFVPALKQYIHDNNITNLDDIIKLFNLANIKTSFGGDDLQIATIAKVLNKDLNIITNPNIANTPPNNQVNRSSLGNDDDSNPPSDITSTPDNSYNQDDGNDQQDPNEIPPVLGDFLSNKGGLPNEFIEKMIGKEYINGIDFESDRIEESTSQKSYMKIFVNRALQHIKNLNSKRKLENFTTTGEGLSYQEIKTIFKNSMPEPAYIKRIGIAIDKIHQSNRFNYSFNAHVMNPYKQGATRKWKRIDIPRNSWKKELYIKMMDISPSQLPRSNKAFLDAFTKSTWGDSAASKLAKGNDPRDEKMYLHDKSTNQRFPLSEYLEKNM